jgi:hypothetical protein
MKTFSLAIELPGAHPRYVTSFDVIIIQTPTRFSFLNTKIYSSPHFAESASIAESANIAESAQYRFRALS